MTRHYVSRRSAERKADDAVRARAAKAERLAIPVSVAALALKSGVPASILSEAERGLRVLSEEQEARRRDALAQLVKEAATR